MRNLLDSIIETIQAGEKAVLAAIIKSAGSSPRGSGARMLVREDGSFVGTVGGGSLEARCIEEAMRMSWLSLSHVKIDFHLDQETVAGEGMVCGGSATVLLQKVSRLELAVFEELKERYLGGERPVLLTVLDKADGEVLWFDIARPEVIAKIGSNRLENFLQKTSRMPVLLDAGDKEVYVEPLVSPGLVHLVGAGHVAQAAAEIAAFADFEVVVIDDREAFANGERYPMAKEIRVLDSFESCFSQLSPDDYVVIVTRGHLHDKEVLGQALRTDAGYIGMIGSAKKRNLIFENLLQEGFSEGDLARVYSPIGLSIGADTPNEIAVSIVGELIQVRSGAGSRSVLPQ